MENLPFQEEELDLIWSEGAIYNIGFERGLNEWRKFLKQGGYIAVTENTWFSEERPAEIQDFWQKAYPEIDTISNKVAQMQKAGYLPIATFVVPDTIWTDYYALQPQMQESFLKKYNGNKSAEEFIAYQRYEAELYRQIQSILWLCVLYRKKNQIMPASNKRYSQKWFCGMQRVLASFNFYVT